ncbi:hypothetical protein [Clostridium sp.]|uniref:hypothetical protein n=1 Tax=Clostridium sp. TaxID=1506 RepID=UPI00284CB86D|nr:hypothetical protein [Clostridium sp.]MDR3593232.1 hypothetical protein [Clostridium sp.]
MLEDLGLPHDIVKWCIFPYVYQNTNTLRKQHKKQRKALIDQISKIYMPFVKYIDRKVIKDKYVLSHFVYDRTLTNEPIPVYDYVIVKQLTWQVFKYTITVEQAIDYANKYKYNTA